MKARLTPMQKEVLAYMREFFQRNDQLPPCRYIRDRFGWASDNSAQTHIDQLVIRGHLERNQVGKYRFRREVEAA